MSLLCNTGDWFTLGQKNSYRKIDLYSMDWPATINLEQMTVHAASYGGPVALVKDFKQFLKLSGSGSAKPVIRIFNCAGKLISSINDVPEQAEEPAAKEKDDENDEEPDSSPEKVEEPATEEIDEKEDEDAKSSPEEADEPQAKDASPEEPEEEESTPEEPEVEESSPKEIQEEPKSPEEQKTEEPEDEEKSPEENQDEQESAEEQNPQESAEESPAEPAPAEETKEDEVESTPEDEVESIPEDTNGEEQDQPAEPEVAPAKLDEPLEDIPEESTSPISDTPMDEYEQNSQEQPEPAPEKSDEPPKPAPESDFEELQNLLTEGLRPPDLDCSTSVTEAGTQPPETGGLDVDLDSLLNNKLDEISGGAPQQPDDLQLAIERELLNEMMPPAAAAQANEGGNIGQEQPL